MWARHLPPPVPSCRRRDQNVRPMPGLRGEVAGIATGGRVALAWVGLHCVRAPLARQGQALRGRRVASPLPAQTNPDQGQCRSPERAISGTRGRSSAMHKHPREGLAHEAFSNAICQHRHTVAEPPKDVERAFQSPQRLPGPASGTFRLRRSHNMPFRRSQIGSSCSHVESRASLLPNACPVSPRTR